MGIHAARTAAKWCKSAGATTIIDPFCGKGTILAVANSMGMRAVGVELSPKRARIAARIQLVKATDMTVHSAESFSRQESEPVPVPVEPVDPPTRKK